MSTSTLAALGWGSTPEPPYYVAIFTSQRSEDIEGFETMAERMVELVRHMEHLKSSEIGAPTLDEKLSSANS
jgi:hypothetical protein